MMDLWINAAVCHPRPWVSGDGTVPGADLLNKGAARRMTAPMRRAVCCALQALAEARTPKPAGIYMATGLGQVEDTIGFLNEMEANPGGILSPTGFMRSTHNTVGGTLALLLGADGPNITFSHGMASFAWALENAALHVEGDSTARLLVGACDEGAALIQALAVEASLSEVPAEGAAFLVVSGTRTSDDDVRITCIWPAENVHDKAWWGSDTWLYGTVGVVLYGRDPFTGAMPVMPDHVHAVDHRVLVGLHGSAPAQAVVRAVHMLRSGEVLEGSSGPAKRVLVVDRHGSETSAILLER